MATESDLKVRDGFRLRGTSVSRLETFVDAAFAFGVTMLVISVGSVPKSIEELLLALRSVPAFAACFLILVMLWSGHEEWSRRYGIEDDGTTWWSLLFVFVMLVWIYPLRLIFAGAMDFFTGGWAKSGIGSGSWPDLRAAYLIYGVGFAAMNGILLALHRAALRAELDPPLDSVEILETRRSIGSFVIHIGVACLSMLAALCLHPGEEEWTAAIPGLLYSLTGVGFWWHHARFHRMRAKLETR